VPIQIPNDLPAAGILQNENIFVMKQTRAETQHIRPLEIVLLNLMPTKIVTETQLSRVLGNTPLQVHLELMMVSGHKSKNTSEEHLLSFYKSFDELKHRKFDGMVITGAPLEHLAYEDVDYWDELCRIMEWTKTNVHSTLHICWAAFAGLYYHYNINSVYLDKKIFGVFPHTADYKRAILLRGFDDIFYESILRYCPKISSFRINNVYVFKNTEESISKTTFISSLIKQYKIIETDDLIYLLKESYGINMDLYDLKESIENTDIYYNSIMDTFYMNYNVFIEEV
jgi:homoserine O-succinyltransferase